MEDFHKDKKAVAVINIDESNNNNNNNNNDSSFNNNNMNKQTEIVRDSIESFHYTARED